MGLLHLLSPSVEIRVVADFDYAIEKFGYFVPDPSVGLERAQLVWERFSIYLVCERRVEFFEVFLSDVEQR